MFTLLTVLVALVAFALEFAGQGEPNSVTGSPPLWPPGLVAVGLLLIWGIGSVIPSIAVQVRRFHDQDKSGWFCLLAFIPYIGGLIIIVFMCIEGTRGPNRFGPDPRNAAASADVFT